jgi:hypothetical protein
LMRAANLRATGSGSSNEAAGWLWREIRQK